MSTPGTRVEWLGELVEARVLAGVVVAIDETTHAAAEDAKQSHWWQARRAEEGLEGQIVAEPAKLNDRGEVVGRFGSSLRAAGFYGLFLERRMPFLRPAADRHFPRLVAIIRGRTRWM